MNIKNLIFTALIIYVATQFSGYLGKEAAQNVSSARSNENTEIKPVITLTKIQDSIGGSEADFTRENLKILEKWILTTMLKKGKNSYAAQGYDPKDFNPTYDTKSMYIIASGKKLAIIKVNVNNIMRDVTIIGYKEKEQITVACVRPSNHDIPIWSGKCGDELNKAFGIKLIP